MFCSNFTLALKWLFPPENAVFELTFQVTSGIDMKYAQSYINIHIYQIGGRGNAEIFIEEEKCKMRNEMCLI